MSDEKMREAIQLLKGYRAEIGGAEWTLDDEELETAKQIEEVVASLEQAAQRQGDYDEQHERFRHDSEDLTALHMNLDGAGVPRRDVIGKELSVWARVTSYAQRQGGEAVAWQVLDAGGDVHDMFDSLREAEQEACESGDTIRPLYPAPQPAVPEGLHSSVLAFARAMQHKLDANKFKDGRGWTRNPDGSRSGWAGVSPDFLIEKLEEECSELIYEVQRGGGDLIWKEAADVGNIAMMLADVTDALAFVPESLDPHPDWIARSERLPTQADAEPYNRLIGWDSDHSESVLCFRHEVIERRCISRWKPTGLKRPEPPEDV